jgi:feruloyl esterase
MKFQAFVAASKFPADWDHIIAAYPAINETGLGLFSFGFWGTTNTNPKTGCSYIENKDLATIHTAALTSCDKADGLEDGILTYPDLCEVNWDFLRCNTHASLFNSTTCFSPEKIAAAKRIYTGPRNSHGVPYGYHPYLPGTELNWGSLISDTCQRNSYFNQSIDFARHMSFRDDDEKPQSWTPWDLDYEKDSKLVAYMEETFFAGTSADLTNFKNNGGKMLFFQGLADYQVMAGWSVAHYNRYFPNFLLIIL